MYSIFLLLFWLVNLCSIFFTRHAVARRKRTPKNNKRCVCSLCVLCSIPCSASSLCNLCGYFLFIHMKHRAVYPIRGWYGEPHNPSSSPLVETDYSIDQLLMTGHSWTGGAMPCITLLTSAAADTSLLFSYNVVCHRHHRVIRKAKASNRQLLFLTSIVWERLVQGSVRARRWIYREFMLFPFSQMWEESESQGSLSLGEMRMQYSHSLSFFQAVIWQPVRWK